MPTPLHRRRYQEGYDKGRTAAELMLDNPSEEDLATIRAYLETDQIPAPLTDNTLKEIVAKFLVPRNVGVRTGFYEVLEEEAPELYQDLEDINTTPSYQ